ncbi:hypothetical protein [Burkholderia territorii]|nr:hypothetical protein [Burkholderia territorii]
MSDSSAAPVRVSPGAGALGCHLDGRLAAAMRCRPNRPRARLARAT